MATSDKGIVVLGVPRSGTTLLRRILDAHPRIACPGETCMLSACARFLQTETVADGLEFGAFAGLSFAGFPYMEILERLQSFAFGFHESYAQRQGKARWAEKTAVDIFHLERISELCTDRVQYLIVVRHGFDVACSNQEFANKGFTYLSELHHYIQRYPRPLEAFAHAWVDANNLALNLIESQPGNSKLVRYEDLVGNPNETAAEIFGFLEEDFNEQLLERAFEKPSSTGFGDWKTYNRSSFDDSSLRRWQSLPPGITSRLASICNPMLTRLGYPEEREAEPVDQSKARRKYEFSLVFGATQDKK